MNDGTLRRIAWRQIFPWLLLFRTPRLATRLPLLLVGFVAVVILPWGWRLAAWALLSDDDAARFSPGDWIQSASSHNFSDFYALVGSAFQYGPEAYTRRIGWWHTVVTTPWELRTTAYMVIGSVWSLSIWSLLGAIIARIAIADLGCEQRVGLVDAVRFSFSRFRAVISAPLLPLCALVILSLFPAGLGLLSSLADVTQVVAAAVWILVIPVGVLITLVAYGLFFGWPLMPPVIAAERNGDSFEALSRAFAYCTQRPFHLVIYGLLAAFLGGATWVLVDGFATALIALTALAAIWGGGDAALFVTEPRPDLLSPTTPQQVMFCWVYLIRALAAGFHFSFFWTAASAIYLLLRRDVDETDFDELDVGDGAPPLPLPEIAAAPDIDAEGPQAAESSKPHDGEGKANTGPAISPIDGSAAPSP